MVDQTIRFLGVLSLFIYLFPSKNHDVDDNFYLKFTYIKNKFSSEVALSDTGELLVKNLLSKRITNTSK